MNQVCRQCGKEKPDTEYHADRSRKAGINSTCKICRLSNLKVQRGNEPGANYARVKAWRQANREKINAYNRRYAMQHPEWTKKNRRKYKLRYAYGMTIDQFDLMAESQGGVCAVVGCMSPIRDVDHDHSTGKVRGLLCSNCNKAIGLLADDPARIHGLATYLENANGSAD